MVFAVGVWRGVAPCSEEEPWSALSTGPAHGVWASVTRVWIGWNALRRTARKTCHVSCRHRNTHEFEVLC